MGTPIRVLCVFSVLSRGGAETMCMNLYRKINREKVQFDFVKHSDATGEYEEEILSLGGKIYTAPKFKFSNFFAYRKWWKKHFKQHPEHKIIHAHYFTVSSVVFKIAHKFKRFTVGHAHTSKPNYAKFNLSHFIKECLVRRIEKNSDFCFACSKDSGEYFFRKKEFKVLNNAIDTALFEFETKKSEVARREFGINSDSFVVGTVGSFTGVKNPHFSVEIIKSLAEQNINFKFLWVGDGTLIKEIQQKVSDLGLTDYVIFTGSRGDVHHLMQAMDVFVLPSLFEGLPVVSIEAQASGLPTLLSENVSTEAQKTDFCKFLPINNVSVWVEEILSYKDNFERKSVRDKIISAGYDITNTMEYIENFYLNIDRGEI